MLTRLVKDVYIEIICFFESIQRIFEYLPIIWKDRDWGEHYIYRVLAYKIARTRKQMGGSPKTNKFKYIKQMRTCELLLGRLERDEYWEALEAKREARWGELTVDFEKIEPGEISGRIHLTRPKCITKEDKELESKQIRWDCEHENMLRKQDLDLFAKIFVRNSQSWSD